MTGQWAWAWRDNEDQKWHHIVESNVVTWETKCGKDMPVTMDRPVSRGTQTIRKNYICPECRMEVIGECK